MKCIISFIYCISYASLVSQFNWMKCFIFQIFVNWAQNLCLNVCLQWSVMYFKMKHPTVNLIIKHKLVVYLHLINLIKFSFWIKSSASVMYVIKLFVCSDFFCILFWTFLHEIIILSCIVSTVIIYWHFPSAHKMASKFCLFHFKFKLQICCGHFVCFQCLSIPTLVGTCLM